MHFAPELGWWSPAIFWFCLSNAVLSMVFTVVVIIGGISDLKYLFQALKDERIDETDDGRVEPTPTEHNP